MKMDKYVSSSLTKITKNVFDVEKVVVTILGDERTKAKRDNQAKDKRGKKKKKKVRRKLKESKSFLQGQLKDSFHGSNQDVFWKHSWWWTVLGLLNWVNDPENQEKIESFTTFLQDSVPVILAGFKRLNCF